MTTDAVHARLLDLCDLVLAEIRLVTLTDGELFAASFTVDRAFSLASNNALAEKVDAFASALKPADQAFTTASRNGKIVPGDF